ncbi:MAG: hypothetical protein ACLGHN_08080 [Bacteriovoracia bacterium]
MGEKKALVVRIPEETQVQLDTMMQGLAEMPTPPKINYTKLICFCVAETLSKIYPKSKERICDLYRDKRKDAKERLSHLSNEKLDAVLKLMDKLDQSGVNA